MYSIYDNEFDMIVDETIEEHIDESIQQIHITLERRLDESVSCNTFKKNIEIINEFGGVYTNLKKYEDEYECNMNMNEGEAQFYATIAFISIKELLITKLEKKLIDEFFL